VFIESVS